VRGPHNPGGCHFTPADTYGAGIVAPSPSSWNCDWRRFRTLPVRRYHDCIESTASSRRDIVAGSLRRRCPGCQGSNASTRISTERPAFSMTRPIKLCCTHQDSFGKLLPVISGYIGIAVPPTRSASGAIPGSSHILEYLLRKWLAILAGIKCAPGTLRSLARRSQRLG